ncbi:MAG: alkaline phosphatase family protein [Planctomycetes bacterium]|nr:alkaline phosphatase family protein [Planctomycetota bacterium]
MSRVATQSREAVPYIALATLFAGILVGVPRRVPRPANAEPVFVAQATEYPRVVVLGIDGLDPELLQETIDKFPERMTHFARLAREHGIHALGTSTPPQSPVAWSNFITGRDPGGHGIYDFLHRDLATRVAIPSTTVSEHAGAYELFGDWKLPHGGDSRSNRSGEAFWTTLAKHGVPADIWRMPANFPVEPAQGWSFSGMMTPAIDSAYGKCTIYTTNPSLIAAVGDARVEVVQCYSNVIETILKGPANIFKQGDPATDVALRAWIDPVARAVALDVAGRVLVLEPGEWSEFVPVTFSLLPMGMQDIGGIVRFYLRSIPDAQGQGDFELYASPVNIDPSAPIAPVSEPADASALVADPRKGIGPFYTQGMPEDVNALKASVVTVREFMQQAELVQDEGERMLDFALERYMQKREGGLLFFYFSGVDLCGHMMWRHSDERHPHHDPQLAAEDSSWWSHRAGSTWKDVIYDLYMEMDPVLGRLREKVGEDATLIVMSDHGFAPYRRRVSLNTWLLENGYLVLKPEARKELPEGSPGREDVFITTTAGHVDWSKTRAYGVGFNGLYLNLKGREQDDPQTAADESGIVDPAAAPALLDELKLKLEAWRDAQNGDKQVVLRADLATAVFSGERVSEAPDILVGYNTDYDNSDEASMGRIPHYQLADNNRGGTFNGSHLMAPEVVKGTLMSNRKVSAGDHRLEDLTVEVLGQYGIPPSSGMNGRAVLEKH